MRTTNKPRTASGGLHATRRISLLNRQPLKPKYSARRSLGLLIVLLSSLGILVQQNSQEISAFLNRPVSKVRMENQWQRVGESEITSLLAAYLGTGFFDFDVKAVKETLEVHPWIAMASVKRIWPDTLSLQLTEEVAIARWGDNKLLNQLGGIFQPSEIEALSTLPKLVGPDKLQYEVMQQYQVINQLLFPSGLRLTGLSLSSRGSWQLTVNDELQVTIGRFDVIEKLDRFLEFYASQPATEIAQFEAVDLRYSNGIAVKNKERVLVGYSSKFNRQSLFVDSWLREVPDYE